MTKLRWCSARRQKPGTLKWPWSAALAVTRKRPWSSAIGRTRKDEVRRQNACDADPFAGVVQERDVPRDREIADELARLVEHRRQHQPAAAGDIPFSTS